MVVTKTNKKRENKRKKKKAIKLLVPIAHAVENTKEVGFYPP
jgi:hypothetical protein